MSEFKIISTQEEFEELMKPRLTRASETARKKALEEIQPQLDEAKGLKDEVSTLKESIGAKDGRIKELETELSKVQSESKAFEIKALRSQIVMENKLPIEFADRLRGETAEELQQDAQTLTELLKSNKSYVGLPHSNSDDKKPVDGKEAGYMKLLNEIKGD